MRNIRSEINYCLGKKPLMVSLTNLADYREENVEKEIVFGLKPATVGSTDSKCIEQSNDLHFNRLLWRHRLQEPGLSCLRAHLTSAEGGRPTNAGWAANNIISFYIS
jgi:hypothetical protein